MLANAVRLCDASFGNLYLRDGEFFRTGRLPQHAAGLRRAPRRGPTARARLARLGRMLRTRPWFMSPTSPPIRPICERDPGVVAFVELAGTRTVLAGADAQGRRADRRHRDLPPGGAPVHRQADRAGHRTSPPRPSSPSRTLACSTSCANRCSSRPPPPTCSRSSASSPGELQPVFDAMLVECGASVRGQLRPHVALRRQRISHRGASWRAAGSEPMAKRSLVPWQSGSPIGPRRQDPSAGPCCRSSYDRSLPCRRSIGARWCRHRGHPHIGRRADAQGERIDRSYHHLPQGGPTVHRQAGRAGHELRRIRP